ncbi:MAG TPA: methyltransferase domain-containing protein [Hydrogenophaga sp.]|uniref:class I SAM-dependent methyltransferase n=1 Tax=Hydrogenophaga sp. TaxID=1904254 RepID=UPI002C69B66C|nr:methyltransferase domain-containing protein [Hydrogenophaga sp.]HMN92375.1 methyltransferase domain-containing protein [Hydrogenophaga sp.]HMP10601.1 methyltransferase domain-containing protein [Hydrogenophaga sp.]
MNKQIIGLGDWFATPPGRYLLAWEQAQFDLAVADLFGFNALQLGLPELLTLQSNRMPHRWLSLPEQFDAGIPLAGSALPGPGAPRAVHLLSDAAALPFAAASLDLLVLPHTLELSADPHQVLREVERVLVPEGRVVIACFNPVSLWGWRQGRARLAERLGLHAFGASTPFLPEVGRFIGPWRLRDWLRLLSFEVESDRYGLYQPAVRTEKWQQRLSWMDRLGARWWPVFGAVYFVVAVKRVRGMRLLGPAWRPRKAAHGASVPVAQRR